MKLDDIKAQFRAQLPEVLADLRAKANEHDPTAPHREAGYSIRNVGDEAVVRIYDEIWFLGVNALDLTADLDTITAPNIRVEINSPGGDIWDGIAIYNALRTHPAKVTTRVDGIAASIASIIAQAGDRRIMVGGSQMMIHNAYGLTIGDHADHADFSAVLSKQDEILAGIYATASGRPAAEFAALMDAETWMTADEAVAHGLADEVLEPAAPKDSAPTLHNQIAATVEAVGETISSAERVAALRIAAGKTLSGVNRDGLDGLNDALGRLSALLNEEDAPASPDYAAAKLALAKRENDWRATLPVLTA